MRKHVPVVLVVILALLPAGLFAQAAKEPQAAPKAPQPGDELIVPAHTQVPLELTSAISSRTAYVGEPIYCQTIYPITVGNVIVIPVGTYVQGVVTQVVRPGRIHGKAQLGLRFDSLTLPGGFTKPLNGTLAGFAGNGKESFNRKESKIQGESSKGRDAETVAIPAGEGAGIGSIVGIHGGHAGEGAAIGGASGAMGGLIYVLATRGREIVLRRGTDLQLQFTRPFVLYRYEVDPSPAASPTGPAFPKRDPGPA